MAIGYACVHIGSKETKLSTLRLAGATPEALKTVIARNLRALSAMLRYNADSGIKLFRISSDIIPLASHPAMTLDWQTEFRDTLSQIGSDLKRYGMRVSMHPGQYTVLNSPTPAIVEKAVADLQYHTALLDALGCDTKSKIILHVGGVYGDKPAAMRRFVEAVEALDSGIKARLVIENDDVSFTAADVLAISKLTGLPGVFDVYHHQLNPSAEAAPVHEWITRFAGTWGVADGTPKIHYSQPHAKARGGAHSETIDVAEFMHFYRELPARDLDIMLEVKDKNLSALKCVLATQETLKIKQLEAEWARYKYLVLGQSAAVYQRIRQLLKDKQHPDALAFYALINEAMALPEDTGAQSNAAQHIWGYYKDDAADTEKQQFQTLLAAYQNGKRSLKALKNFLFRMAEKQQQAYLLQSLYFYRSPAA